MKGNSIITIIDYESNSNALKGDTKPLVKEDVSSVTGKEFLKSKR